MKIFIGSSAPNDSYTCVGFRMNIDDFAENAQCEEINAPNMLDYITTNQQDGFVKHLISKLRHGGTLTLGGTDIVSTSLLIFNKSINNEQANNLLFGSNSEPPKTNLSSLEELRKLLLANGLRIKTQIPGVHMLIVATRQ